MDDDEFESASEGSAFDREEQKQLIEEAIEAAAKEESEQQQSPTIEHEPVIVKENNNNAIGNSIEFENKASSSVSSSPKKEAPNSGMETPKAASASKGETQGAPSVPRQAIKKLRERTGSSHSNNSPNQVTANANGNGNGSTFGANNDQLNEGIEKVGQMFTESTSSWLNWGSSFVKNVGGNLLDSVDKIYDQLDPEFAAQKAAALGKEGEGANPPVGSSSSTSPKDANTETAVHSPKEKASINNNNAKIGESDFFLLNTLDKTFDFASEAIGSAVFTGFKKIEEAKLTEKAGNFIDFVKKDVEANPMLNQGLNVGTDVMSKGLSALEKLGQKTVNIISETAKIDISGNGSGLKPPLKTPVKSARELTLKAAFEDGTASANFHAIEAISNESANKLKEVKDSASKDSAKSFKSLEALFDFEQVLELIDEDIKESHLATEKGKTELTELLNEIGWIESSSNAHLIDSLIDSIKVKGNIANKIVEDFEVVADDANPGDDVSSITMRALDREIRDYSIMAFCTFTERICSIMLRIAESMVLLQSEKEKKADLVAIGEKIQKVMVIFINELQLINHNLSKDEFAEAYKVKINVLKMTAEDFDFTWKEWSETNSKESLDAYEKALGGSLEETTAFIQESMEFLLPIAKLCIVNQATINQ